MCHPSSTKADFRTSPIDRVVLIVDPLASSRQSLERLVQELGVKTIGASGALDALTALQKRSDISLILAEESLPGPSGTALLQAVRFLWPSLTRVLLGQNLEPEVLMRAVNGSKVHRVLTRDMHPVTLRDEVQAALDECGAARSDFHSNHISRPPYPASGVQPVASRQTPRRRASGT